MTTANAADRINLPLHLLVPDPDQPRKASFDDESLEEITASVKEQGVLQELLVEGPLPNGKYQIVYGERRYRAALKAGLEEVPVRVSPLLSDEERLEIQLFENLMRRDLDIRERAAAISRYVGRFPDQKSAAAKLGLSEGRLSQILELASLKPEVSALASDRVVRDSSTLVMINQLVKHSPDEAGALIEKARANGKVSRKDVSVALAPFRRKKNGKGASAEDALPAEMTAPPATTWAEDAAVLDAAPSSVVVETLVMESKADLAEATIEAADTHPQQELPGFEEVRPDKLKRVRSTLNIAGSASSRVVIAKLVDAYLALLEQSGSTGVRHDPD